MKQILSKLLSAYGATGREENVAKVIEEMISPYVDSTRIDALGNLIAVRKGEGKRLMFAAHMDHIGFVVTDIDDNGFLRVFNVGGIRKVNSINRHVVFANGVNGVLANEDENAMANITNISTMYIDIGAKDREDARKMVNIGDVAVYAPDYFELANNMMAGPAMDNRVGCCVLIGMLMALKERKNEIVAVFTTQEEVGLRGARAAAYDVDPDFAIALDVTLCGDTPKGPKISVKAGEGPCVKILDSSLICSPAVVTMMEDAAERANIAYQREVLTAGGTDAAAIQLTRGGVPSGVLSIACRYVHSACEAISLSDVEGGVRLLTALADGELKI